QTAKTPPGGGARAGRAGGPRPLRGQGAGRARSQAGEGGPVNPFGDPRKLMKQLQQAQEKIQAEIAALVVEAAAGGGMVKVEMDGQKQVRSIKIDPEVVSKDDVEMLQDLIVAAVNEAARKADEAMAQKMGGMMGGLKLPSL